MNERTDGRGRAALVEADCEFTDRDASLLEAIARTGSVARAASELDRSRARALSRIEALEAAFGTLVARQRGGSGGGGSTLTENGRRVLDRYDRLQAAVDAVARTPETVLTGTVTGLSGELARAETEIGTVRGIHDSLGEGDAVQARIGADAVTLQDPGEDPEPDATSARNRVRGRLSTVDGGETVRTVHVDVDGKTVRALVTAESVDRLDITGRGELVLSWKATATRLVPTTTQ